MKTPPATTSRIVGTTLVTFSRFYGYDLPRVEVPPKFYLRERWWLGDLLRRLFG